MAKNRQLLRKALLKEALSEVGNVFAESNQVWTEKPVSFREFVESTDHMGFPPLSERQLGVTDFLFGNDVTKVFDNKNTLGVLAFGKGCPAKGMRVLTPRTQPLVKIEDFDGTHDVLSKSGSTVTDKPASYSWLTGYGSIFRVTTKSGFSIDVYEGHKFLTGAGEETWKALRDLRVGDAVAVLKKWAYAGVPCADTESSRVGQLVAGVRGPADDPELAGRYGIHEAQSFERRIPDAVFAWDDRAIVVFLTELYADGAARSEQDVLVYASANAPFAKQLKLLLLRIGVSSSIIRKTDSQWNVSISELDSLKRFFELVHLKDHADLQEFVAGKEFTSTGDTEWDTITGIQYLREDEYYDLEVPDTHNYVCEGFVSHNSGKDAIASLILLYIAYWCLCLESPQRFFNLPEGEPIDLVNIAINAEQANSIFFEKVRQRVLRWRWLSSRYNIKMSGAFLGQVQEEDFFSQVIITKNGILFPKMIRAISGHSGEASQEGKNVLFFCADECSGFDDSATTNRAQKLFDMLRSSAVSRFGERWKGLCISFPRYRGDFILRMYDRAQTELHWYSDKAATWEVKPAHLFKDYPEKYFEFDGWKIPLEFEKEFKLDPNDARGKYGCEPVEMSSPFIENPERIDWCVDHQRIPIIDTEDYLDDKYVKKRIVTFRTDSTFKQRIITIDLGLVSDSAALGIYHKEFSETDGVLLVQDWVGTWSPNKNSGYIVSLTDIEDFILKVREKFNIAGVYFDQWNSALLSQRLASAGIPSEIYYLNFQDYRNWKGNVYLGKIKLLPFQRQVDEAKRLIMTRATRVDHPSDGCFAGTTEVLLADGTKVRIDALALAHTRGSGILVNSFDIANSCSVSKRIVNAFFSKIAEVVQVTFDDGYIVRCTPDHRFLLADGTFCPITSVPTGAVLRSMYGRKFVRIHSIEPVQGFRPVYDLTIKDTHNFALANGLYVHNSKDVVDTVVGANKLLLGTGAAGNSAEAADSEIVISSNLHAAGGTFIGG